MNFLLKIVEGPNKGAEIALVEGVAVTLGKSDDCDIVLVDQTLPDAPLKIEATADSVMTGLVVPASSGEEMEPLEPFSVKTLGATSFAVGPADAPWGELKWPEKAESRTSKAESRDEGRGEGREAEDEGQKDDSSAQVSSPSPKEDADQPEDKKRKRGGCCGCLVVLLLLVLALAGVAWFYRDRIKESGRFDRICEVCSSWRSRLANWIGVSGSSCESDLARGVDLASIAERYGLTVEEGNGPAKLVGNLKTRAERLRATAEAYNAKPGVELDLSDDESFRTAAEDALFTLTEGALNVLSATNRVLAIGGVSRSPEALRRTLKALDADLPRLRSLDVSEVRFGAVPRHEDAAEETGQGESQDAASRTSRIVSRKTSSPPLPVCGILTKPYPCLVMRDGTRVMEGASLGESVILKIEVDAVTVTNSTGRFTWKP